MTNIVRLIIFITPFFLMAGYTSCSYELGEAQVVAKKEDKIVVSWKGDNMDVDCDVKNIYEESKVGDWIWVVVGRLSGLPRAVATYDDCLNLPKVDDENLGPFYYLGEDGHLKRKKGEVVWTEETFDEKGQAKHNIETEADSLSIEEQVNRMFQGGGE